MEKERILNQVHTSTIDDTLASQAQEIVLLLFMNKKIIKIIWRSRRIHTVQALHAIYYETLRLPLTKYPTFTAKTMWFVLSYVDFWTKPGESREFLLAPQLEWVAQSEICRHLFYDSIAGW